ncbi:GntR family transcriptional regulator (plasmid) [Citricoccus sp. SGAir0253]|uniref:GntR family transcriptional regulator n=1 Tax=Citricoccus sp. SGAir0253 TaxID=2567881 RepID=UPI0010CCC66C|nr:GntR family transcriptional regulator [Citricoccus sp. SGAir0253]QCU79639.1 GntR family transcriptional regulator [Citricoccus sp. SGAir0253]
MDTEGLNLPGLVGRLNLREEVTAAIRAALVTGQMQPGQLYSAPKLAEQFGVSATPVREALLDLVTEGHFEVARNKGFRVRRLNASELDELAEIRLYLEPPAMAAVAQAAASTPEVASTITALRPLAEEIVRFAQTGDLLAYIEADTQFHAEFLTIHGNAQLVELVRDLRTRSRLFGLESLFASGALSTLAEEHVRMVELGAQGHAEELAALTRQHIGHVREEWAGDAGEPG